MLNQINMKNMILLFGLMIGLFLAAIMAVNYNHDENYPNLSNIMFWVFTAFWILLIFILVNLKTNKS